MGLGMAGGPEIVAHLARALHKLGFFIGTQDAVNAFNAMHRQALLDVIHSKWPEAVAAFNTYYGIDSACLFTSHLDDIAKIHVFLSQQGTRMGCVLGSIGFDLVVDNIYQQLAAKYPHFELFALTDDLICGIPPPVDDSPDAWTTRLSEYKSYLADYDSLANPVGLFRHADKGHCCVPLDFPAPLRDFDLPGTDICSAVKLSGTYVGTPEGVHRGTVKKLQSILPRFTAIKKIGESEPQIGLRLAMTCGSNAFDYVPRTTPPMLIMDSLNGFHSIQKEVRMSIAEDPALEVVVCSDNRIERAHTLAEIGHKLGGAGDQAITDKAHAAFLASIICALHNSRFQKVAYALKDEIVFSYKELCKQLHVSYIRESHALARFLPSDPALITQPGFVSTLPLQTKRKRPQKLIMQQVTFYNLKRFREMTVLSTEICFRKEDRAHFLHITSKSQATRALWSDMLHKANRINGPEFRHWFRYHLNLPPLAYIGNGVPMEGFDYPVQKCLHSTCANALITATRDHSASCLSAMSARSRLHRSIHDTLKWTAYELGGSARDPPKTSEVLNNMYSDLELSLIMPKHPTADDTAFLKQVQGMLASIRSGPTLNQNIAAAVRRRVSQLEGREVCGRHLDLTFTLPFSSEEALIDASCLHPTCPTHLPSTLKWTLDCFTQSHNTEPTPAQLTSRVDRLDPSPPVAKRVITKRQTYACLMQLLREQMKTQTRSHQPVLYPIVITHSGELCPDIFNLINKLGQERFIQHKHQKPTDLSCPKIIRGEFRGRVKDHLLAANAAGVGRMFLSSGQFGSSSTVRRRVVRRQLGTIVEGGSVAHGWTNNNHSRPNPPGTVPVVISPTPNAADGPD
jgi:hypothetical protein